MTRMTMSGFPPRVLAGAMLVMGLAAAPASSQTPARQTVPPPAPKPFPGQPATSPTTPPPATTPAQAVPPAISGTPNEASLGAPIYPAAEFLGSFDAGRGQRLYMYGTNMTYIDVVGYYKTAMKTGGREIFRAPATQQFDLPGVKFVEETMAVVPSIVVKDYTWGGSDGYLFVSGTTEKRFKTIIQIVPVAR